MKRFLPIIAFLSVLSSCCNKSDIVNLVFDRAEVQYAKMYETTDTLMYPRSVKADTLFCVGATPLNSGKNWTNGFYAGTFWKLYEYTGKESWKQIAREVTNGLEVQKDQNFHHDIGFIMMPSFGNAYLLAPEEGDKEILIYSAKTALTRYSAKVGLIMSWDPSKSKYSDNFWKYPVIIDNMMNLELLFEATKMSGDSTYYKAAISHADKTMKNHIREDYSAFHVVSYDPETGEPEFRQTAQGFSDESAWSRGQAWAIYGFTMCYRYTHKPEYLATAKGAADFFINAATTPEDGIPYWDFNIGQFKAPWNYIPDEFVPEPRDASAAAIASSALIELAGYVDDAKAAEYIAAAEKMLKSLATPAYLAEEGENHNFLLMHSTASRPVKVEVDTPLNYADYYYLEALLRYKHIK